MVLAVFLFSAAALLTECAPVLSCVPFTSFHAPSPIRDSGTTCAQNQRFWEVEDYAQSYRDGVLTPSQAMERLLEGVETLAELRCFESIHPEDVMRQAAASDARFAAGSPLSVWDGVPIAVKSMMDVKVCVPPPPPPPPPFCVVLLIVFFFWFPVLVVATRVM